MSWSFSSSSWSTLSAFGSPMFFLACRFSSSIFAFMSPVVCPNTTQTMQARCRHFACKTPSASALATDRSCVGHGKKRDRAQPRVLCCVTNGCVQHLHHKRRSIASINGSTAFATINGSTVKKGRGLKKGGRADLCGAEARELCLRPPLEAELGRLWQA
eukprot:2102229-Rhodomonas_salina.1